MDLLPVHGFVLAGGRSSRMGADKALLQLNGRPMVALALQTLRQSCANVSIAGNRQDLATFAPVVPDLRPGEGPAAGIEAALAASTHDWVLMCPVDLPRMAAGLLRAWATAVLQDASARASYLTCGEEWHPALCLVHRDCLTLFRTSLDQDDRKLTRIFSRLGERLLVLRAEAFAPASAGPARWFTNVNTPEEFAALQAEEASAQDESTTPPAHNAGVQAS